VADGLSRQGTFVLGTTYGIVKVVAEAGSCFLEETEIFKSCHWIADACRRAGMPAPHAISAEQTRLWLLEIQNNYGLKGFDFAIANVGTIAPLLHGLHGSGGESGVAFDEAHAGNFTGFIDYFFKNDGPFGTSAGIRRVLGRNAVSQALLGTFGRENYCGVFAGQRRL
jgi:hypothetical protein